VLRIEFFHECLVFTEGEWDGQPFFLQRWQQGIVANIFGWIDLETGLRRLRYAFPALTAFALVVTLPYAVYRVLALVDMSEEMAHNKFAGSF